MNISVDANLKVDEATSAGNITGINTGTISAPANSLTLILTPVAGWTSTNNPEALVLGREEEADAELRLRATGTASNTGKATPDAIETALLNVDGVSGVNIRTF